MIWTIVFLLAGAGCLGLAVWRLRQWFHRRKGIRIEAGIVDRRYQIPDDGTGIVDNKECGASVDLSFFWQGRSYRKVQDYKGILSVPAPEDKSVPVLFWPETGEWELWTRKRPYWLLLFPGAVFLIATGIALLIGGEGFAPMLGSFRYDEPNLVGQLVYGTGSALGICLCAAAGIGLAPYALGPIFGPFIFGLRKSAGMLEQLEARCIMIILDNYDSDGGWRYSVFCYATPEGPRYWRTKRDTTAKKIQVGLPCPLYRNRHTGEICLEPGLIDAIDVPFAVIRLALGGGFLLLWFLICLAGLWSVWMSL